MSICCSSFSSTPSHYEYSTWSLREELFDWRFKVTAVTGPSATEARGPRLARKKSTSSENLGIGTNIVSENEVRCSPSQSSSWSNLLTLAGPQVPGATNFACYTCTCRRPSRSEFFTLRGSQDLEGGGVYAHIGGDAHQPGSTLRHSKYPRTNSKARWLSWRSARLV